jgi:outer membrane protein assembly factor BamB
VRARLAAAPVIADGKAFTIDTQSTVRAFDAQSGRSVWATQFGTEKGNNASLFGGGVAYDGSRIYATNGLGYVAALDARNGGIIWQVHPGGPLRGSPSVSGDNVYVMSQDNQIYSLKTSDGAQNWSNAAALEIAGVFGTASPAIGQGTVVAGFSSGELNAYRYENGRLVWQDQLSRTTIRTSVASISDVDADPVIDRGQVIALGQGGRMVALELNSGQRQWELNIAGISTPWVAGDWIFVVTDDARLLCVARDSGKVRWIAQLPAFRHPKKKAGPISYSGPVLAGGRLIVVSTEGTLINIDPTNGSFQTQTNIRSSVSQSPVVANQTLYLLDDEGRLHAWR